MDLDRFKTINDSLGHSIGDELLQQIGKRLQANLRKEDTAARLGGDEFILLLSDLGETDELAATRAGTIADHLQTVLAQSFSVNEHELYITSSIGIALFPTNAQQPDDLLKHADSAMYQAKASGGNAAHFFMESMQEAADLRLHLEKELRRAIGEDELSLHYQPFKSLHGDIVGAEALLRWQHPVEGSIAPSTFIPIAEDCGLTERIGQFVVAQACQDLVKFCAVNSISDAFFLSINISPREFSGLDFPNNLLQLINDYEIDTHRIQIELTESTLLMDFDAAREKLRVLKDAGVRLAIDDFGTGHSSLAYMESPPKWGQFPLASRRE